ncbi:MAG: sensor domain-containing protein, partial [Chloroflexi bacterium]|nr:sensor domain-containing protein [Chloroflexota bacterium]
MTADNTPEAPVGGHGALDAMRSFAWSPFAIKTWRAVLAVGLGLFVSIASVSVLSTLFSIGGSLLFLIVGIPFVGLGIEAARVFARVERWRMSMVDGQPLMAHPYRGFDPAPRAPWGPWVRQWAEAEFLDANRWLDVLYVLVAMPLTIIEFTVSVILWSTSIALMLAPLLWMAARSTSPGGFVWLPGAVDPVAFVAVLFVIGLLLLPVAASVTRGLIVLHRAVVQGMLCVDPSAALRRDVERLRDTRSAALEVEASELRRIERDLHDGAQQRLVLMAIDLGLAEERIDTDPAAARRLVVVARVQARQALAELREVVRGV